MRKEVWRKCLCGSPAELSLDDWSVFINLEPLSCQKERRVLERGEQNGGRREPQEHLHTTSVFIYRHVRALQSPPLPPRAGQFTVRPFNFTEIGLWQLCHADEEVFEKSVTSHVAQHWCSHTSSSSSSSSVLLFISLGLYSPFKMSSLFP